MPLVDRNSARRIVQMTEQFTQFRPFFDPCREGRPLSTRARILIALGVGAFFTALNYLAVPETSVFFEQETWIVGAIISTSILALFVAAEVHRGNFRLIDRLTGNNRLSRQFTHGWLSDRAYLLAGTVFALARVVVPHLLGVPEAIRMSPPALFSLYLAYGVAGFVSGMGLWSILGVVVLYLKFVPLLPHTLDPQNPDGVGGIKLLGDSLWFFAMLVAAAGLLNSTYLFSVDWTAVGQSPIRLLFIAWLALPYLLAISIVLIPGLVVRRQVGRFKHYKAEQLRREKAQLFASYKQFREAGDDEIIASKKELNEGLERVQRQMEQLRRMRNSHLDRANKS